MKRSVKLLAIGLAAVALAACSSTGVEESAPASENANTPVVAPPVTTPVAPPVVDVFETLDSVFYFEFDKSTLTAETRRDLNAYATALKASPRNIRLEGHADERGTREYNIALGERRAKSVADYLVASGVSASRIETISYGEENPAVSGSNNTAWQQNRRVELK